MKLTAIFWVIMSGILVLTTILIRLYSAFK